MPIDPEIAALGDSPKAAVAQLDPEIQAAGLNPTLPDTYRDAVKANPDDVARSQEISKRRGIDPHFALANIGDVVKADAMPDFEVLKSKSPVTYQLVTRPEIMGIAHDDFPSMTDMESSARAAKQANTLLQAAQAGFESSATGLAVRRGLPDMELAPDPKFSHELAAAATGMVADLPEMVLGGLMGSRAGALGAAAGGFAVPAALKRALIEHYTHGDIENVEELMRRAKAISIDAAKHGAVGLAMGISGGTAQILGAGKLLTKGAEITGMTVAGAAVEGQTPTMRDAALNTILLTGAHIAGITWERMGEAAKASKVRSRGEPGAKAFAEHADSVSGPAYIPVQKWEAHYGPELLEINKKLGIEQAYEAAKATGGDVEIPAGKYLSKEMDSHRDAFREDVKLSPEAKTVNQIREEAEAKKVEAEKAAEKPPEPDVAARSGALVMGEAIPAPELQHPLLKAAPEVKREFTERALPIVNNLADALGVKVNVKMGTGVFEGAASPNILSGIDPKATPEQVGALARSIQFALRQKAVPWAKADPAGQFAGVHFEFEKLTPEAEVKFQKALEGALTAQAGYTKLGDKLVVVNYGGMNDAAFSAAIHALAEQHGKELGLKGFADFRTGGDYGPEFDWAKDPTGEPILQGLAAQGSPDLHPRLRAAQAAFDALAREYEDGKSHAVAPSEAKPLTYDPYPDLTGPQRAAETRLAQVLSDPDAVARYAALPGTKGGKLLDVDEARHLSPEYSLGNKQRMAYTLATQKPASAWINRRYFELIDEPATGPVLFMAGGGGSGKSTVREGFLKEYAEQAQIIMDGTLANESKAIRQIDAALASGREVTIAYVHRPFETAVRGVVGRAEIEGAGGRWVPSVVLANDHVMSQETYKALAVRYENDPRVQFKLYKVPEAQPGSSVTPAILPVDSIREFSYTKTGEGPIAAIARLTDIARGHNERIERLAEEATKEVAGDQPGGNAPQEQGAGGSPGRVHAEGLQGAHGQGQTPLEQRAQATTESVAAANHEIGQTPKPIKGLDPKVQAELDRAQESARNEAERILLKPQLEEIKARNRALIEAEKAKATAQIENEVANEPVFRAFALFNPEGAPHEITQKTIWKKASDYLNDRLSAEKASHFEAVAEMSGFTSADEMAKKLLLTERGPAFQSEVRARLEHHMAQFADLKDSSAMKAEALRAVHNQKSGELLALQYQVMEGMAQNKAINESTNKARRAYAAEIWEASKKLARDTINSKPVETAGRFRAYYTAERQAAQRYTKALAEGKYQEAGAAKLEQLHNHALAAESLRVRDQIESWVASIEKQQKAEPLSWKDQDHFYQAADLMGRFGFNRPDYIAAKRTESLAAWAARMEEKTNTVEIPEWLMDGSVTKEWKKLTPPELRDLRNALKNIKHVANFEDLAYVVFDKADLGDVAAKLQQEQVANAHNSKGAPLSLHETWIDNVAASKDRTLFQLIAPETWLRKLDGYKNFGPWWKAFYEHYVRGADEKSRMLVENADEYARIWETYTPKEREAMTKKVFIPEFNDSLMKTEIMTMALNWGTESNRARLLEGRNWNEAQIEAVLRREMTERDWATVRKTWKHIDSMWPKIAELYRELTGFEPEKVEAITVKTPFGDIEGGYYPLKSDPRVEVRGLEDIDVSASLADAPPAWRASTKNGFTKGRVEGAQYKVSLDINGIQRHMTDVIHDLTMRKWVLDANRLLARKDVQASISDALGMDGYRMLRDWVKAVAGTNDFKSREFMDDFFNNLRRRTIIANLGLRISSTILQVDDLSAYGRVDPNFGVINAATAVTGFYGRAIVDHTKYKEGIDFVYARSKYMKFERGENIDRDIHDAARREWGKDDRMAKASMVMVSTMDKLLSIPVWTEAYKKGLELHGGVEQKAVDYADLIIRRAQASGRVGDLAAIMRGSEKQKLLTMFYSFMNRRLNLWYEAIDKTKTLGDVPELVGTAMALWVAPTVFSAFVHNGMPNTPEKQKKYLKEILLYPTSLFPVVRDVADIAVSKAMRLPTFAYSPTPITGAVDALSNMVSTLTSRKPVRTEKKIETAAKFASYALPYPNQANVWIFNAADAINGMQLRPSDLTKRRPARERSR